MMKKQAQAQIVISETLTIDGAVLSASPQQVLVQLEHPEHNAYLMPGQSYAIWIACSNGVYQVSAVLVEKQETNVLFQFRRASKEERRSVRRYPCRIVTEAKPKDADEFFEPWEKTISTDISHEGICITSERELAPKTFLEIRFWLVGRDTPVHALARVMHCRALASNRFVIGLKFEQLSRLDQALLRHMFP